MKNILIASALVVIAIGCASASKAPGLQTSTAPGAFEQARIAIAELPLADQAKAAYFARVENTPEAHLPYLVDEARRAVDVPVGTRVEGTPRIGHPQPTLKDSPLLTKGW